MRIWTPFFNYVINICDKSKIKFFRSVKRVKTKRYQELQKTFKMKRWKCLAFAGRKQRIVLEKKVKLNCFCFRSGYGRKGCNHSTLSISSQLRVSDDYLIVAQKRAGCDELLAKIISTHHFEANVISYIPPLTFLLG